MEQEDEERSKCGVIVCFGGCGRGGEYEWPKGGFRFRSWVNHDVNLTSQIKG